MASVTLDMVCMFVASAPGTGTIPLGSVVPFGGVVSFALGGAVDGGSYFYYIQDGNNREFAFGVYSASALTLTRNTVTASVNGVQQTTPINATANAVISSIQSAQSLQAQLTSLQNSINSVQSTLQPEITAVQTQVNALPGGSINKFRNPGMDIAQRGTSGSVASGYSLDGWIIVATGAVGPLSASGGWGTGNNQINMAATLPGSVVPGMSVFDVTNGSQIGTVLSGAGTTTLHLTANALNGSQTGSDSLVFGGAAAWSQRYNANISGNALRINCASGLAACTLKQRIESVIAAQLLTGNKSAQQVTVEFTIFNNTGTSITPQIATGYPGAAIGPLSASGGFNTGGNQINMAATLPLSVVAGMNVFDVTNGSQIGTVQSGAGTTTLHLTANALNGSQTGSDSLLFGGPDNFATVISDLAATNLQSIANATLATVAYTFTPNVNLATGYEVQLQFGSALNAASGYVDISLADIRVTPTATAGLNSSPPVTELRPYHSEWQFCQRYLPGVSGNGPWGVTTLNATTSQRTYVQFPVAARAAPTGLTQNNANFNISFLSANPSGFNSVATTFSGSATPWGGNSASSWAVFTGAEL